MGSSIGAEKLVNVSGKSRAIILLLALTGCASTNDMQDLQFPTVPVPVAVAAMLSHASCSGEIEYAETPETEQRGHLTIEIENCENHKPLYVMLASSERPGALSTSPTATGTVFIRRVVSRHDSWSQAIRIAGNGWIYEGRLSKSELELIRTRARQIADAFLSRPPYCDHVFDFDLSEIDGAGHQRVIESLFSIQRFSEKQMRCLIAQIESKQSLHARSFEPPFGSRERVYHHAFSERRQLILYLLPWLTGFHIEFFDCGGDESCYRRYASAWAFWAAFEYGNL